MKLETYYCPYGGEPLVYPHDEESLSLYDFYSGRRVKRPRKIRSTNLLYCIEHDFYAVKNGDKWEHYNGLMAVLHLIA